MTYEWQPEKIISTDKLFKIAKAYVLKKHTKRTFEDIADDLGICPTTAFNYAMKATKIKSSRFAELVEMEERKIGV